MILNCRTAVAETIFRNTVTTEVRYDSNANIRTSERASSDDVIVLLSPQFDLINQGSRLRLNALYRARGYYYLKNPGINTLSHNASLGMQLALTQKTALAANETITYTKESLESSLVGIQTERSGILSNTASVSMTNTLTEKFSTALSYSNSILRYDSPSAVNSRSDTASVSGTFAATTRVSVVTSYSFTSFSFDGPSGNEHIGSHSLQLGLRNAISDSLQVNFSGGAVYTPSISSHYDWVANAIIRKTFQKSSAEIEYTRSTTNSAGLTDQLNINETYSVRFNRALTGTWNAAVFGNYILNHTKPVAVVDIKSYEAGISTDWRVYEWLSFGAGMSHFNQKSNGVLGEDFKRNNVFINMTIIPFETRL